MSVDRYGAPFPATKSNYAQTSKLLLKCSARVSYFVGKFSYYLNCPTFLRPAFWHSLTGSILCKAPMQPYQLLKVKTIHFQSYLMMRTGFAILNLIFLRHCVQKKVVKKIAHCKEHFLKVRTKRQSVKCF